MIRKWFSHGRRPVDKKRHSSKTIAARKSARPLLELLEDRLALATISYNSTDLDFGHLGRCRRTITVRTFGGLFGNRLTGTTDRSPLGGAATDSTTSS